MYAHQSLVGGAGFWERPLSIGATVVEGQVVCKDANIYAQVGAPASVNDYTEAWGVTLEAATYTATQGAAFVRARTVLSPFAVFKGQCSGGTAADTAFAQALDGNILLNSTASAGGTVISDTNVGTSEFAGGLAVGLTGNNKGAWRVITSHIDNTSTTITAAFSSAIAANDTLIRTFGPGNQGLELTTNFVQFNMKPGAGVDLPDTGHAVVQDVYIDGAICLDPEFVEVQNTTAPVVEVTFVFVDHVHASVA